MTPDRPGGPSVPGLPGERSSLTWWRTAQTATACALVLAKSNLDHAGHAVFGWIGMGLALLVAAAAWLAAVNRAGSSGAATIRIAVVTGLTVALAAAVLIEVILAS